MSPIEYATMRALSRIFSQLENWLENANTDKEPQIKFRAARYDGIRAKYARQKKKEICFMTLHKSRSQRKGRGGEASAD